MKFTLHLLLFPLVLASACAQEQPKQQAVTSETREPAPATVESVWHSHEMVIHKALEGGPIFEDRYMAACKFFENLTGITIRGEGTFVGWLPNEHTAADLQAVRDWYSANQHRLYWDEESKSVQVRGQADSSTRR